MRRDETIQRNVRAVLPAILVGLAGLIPIGAGLAASPADAALPAFYECVKAEKVGGEWQGRYIAKCSEEATEAEQETGRSNEWEAAEFAVGKKRKEFAGKGKGFNWEIKTVGGISCSSSTLKKGRVSGPAALTGLTWVLSGCELSHKQCESGATLGQIELGPLAGEYDYVAGGIAKHEVGIALSGESPERVVTSYRCNEVEFRWRGTFIGLDTGPVNMFTNEQAWQFEQSGGQQRITELEGGAQDDLVAEISVGGGERGGPLEVGIGTEAVSKGETLELRA